jgi:hypothetical protein
MGRTTKNPKTEVLSLRTDDTTAKRIREAAKGWNTVSEFLLDACETLLTKMGKGLKS